MKQSGTVFLSVMRRELAAWFASPVAWIVTGLFVILANLLFFSTFFLVNRAELRGFFGTLPLLFSFFLPAITMRLISEERRGGTLETLFTMPVSAASAVLGKFLAALAQAAAMLVPTLAYVLTVALLGKAEAGPILGGYIGAIFLAGAFAAAGLFASSLTKNQILSFFVAFGICFFLAMLDQFTSILPSSIVGIVEYLAAGYHFESIARGILDTRDVVYFVSVTALFLVLTERNLRDGRSA